MSQEFFVGGPLAGWRNVVNLSMVAYEIPYDGGLAGQQDESESDVTYVRKKWIGGGWLVPIPIWTTGDLKRGTEAPGHIIGKSLPRMPIRAAHE